MRQLSWKLEILKRPNKKGQMYDMVQFTPNQIEGAAKKLLEWQFKNAKWEGASEKLKEAFRQGAEQALLGAAMSAD